MEVSQALALYLAEKRHVKFEWGVNDCNTLVVEFHDKFYGTKYYQRLYKKYSNRVEAVRFTLIEINASQWFVEAGYDVISTYPRDGDVISDGFAAWLVFNGDGYTFHEGGVLSKQPVNQLLEHTVTWRKNHG